MSSLAYGYGDAEVVLEAGEQLGGDLRRVGERRAARPCGNDDPDRRARSTSCPRRAPRTDRPRTRPGSSAAAWSRRTSTVFMPPASACSEVTGVLASATQRLLGVDRQLPRHLERRLVERRERLARVGRLELRERVPVAGFLRGVDAVAVVLVHLAGVGDAHRRRAGGERAGERQRDVALLRVGDRRRLVVDRRRRDRDLVAVEPDHVGGRGDLERGRDRAGEVLARRIDRQLDLCCASGARSSAGAARAASAQDARPARRRRRSASAASAATGARGGALGELQAAANARRAGRRLIVGDDNEPPAARDPIGLTFAEEGVASPTRDRMRHRGCRTA